MKEENKSENKMVFLKDYTRPAFSVDNTYLDFSVFDTFTIVSSKIFFKKSVEEVKDLFLNGEDLELISIFLNDKYLKENIDYKKVKDGILLYSVPDKFFLSTQVIIYPEKNTRLEGLYKAGDLFLTQCEAEGFRRITYFLDRPDVMTKYTVRIEADKDKYPTLLSNGNLCSTKDLSNGRHEAVWKDPHKKPCYLFALVVGILSSISKNITTNSGKDILLEVYTDPKFISQADFALKSLERAINWDEDTFGLVYDLDRYMIVATEHFNMGAMENKGLNIFNSVYVLATSETATDSDFLGIQAVIAHEYLHNWTGNRVTCRDWFQLSLKEGLTVFRDGLFSADFTSKGIKRLTDARIMQEHQFIEDDGPTSHPVRPDKYVEINNFYTLTIYEKGAEIIHMLFKMLGEETFKKGMKLYFERFDGKAVTIEDFIDTMSFVSGFDLTDRFFKWYTQSGTPKIIVKTDYNSEINQLSINFKQEYKKTCGEEKESLIVPISYKVYNRKGGVVIEDSIFILDKESDILIIDNVIDKPVISILREFSAPVKLHFNQDELDCHIILKEDDDLYNRHRALNCLLNSLLKKELEGDLNNEGVKRLSESFLSIINSDCDKFEKALLFTIPPLQSFYDIQDEVDVPKLNKAYKDLIYKLFNPIKDNLFSIVKIDPPTGKDLSKNAMGERKYWNEALNLLAGTYVSSSFDEALEFSSYLEGRLSDEISMTIRMGIMSALNKFNNEVRNRVLSDFLDKFSKDPNVVDKWFSLNAIQEDDDVLDTINKCLQHKLFDLKNPNKVRSLLGTFSNKNPVGFHKKNGKGYELLAEKIKELDKINPSIAARMCTPLINYKKFSSPYANKMEEQLNILYCEKLSKDCYEVIQKALNK